MADLHKLTVQEALNAGGSGGQWTVNAVANTGSNASENNTIHVPVSGAGQLGIYSAGDIYFNFTATADTNCSTANDMILPGGVLTFITVPRGLGSTIYFNHLSTSTTEHAVRIVEV